MSLVGPRPLILSEADQVIGRYRRRLRADAWDDRHVAGARTQRHTVRGHGQAGLPVRDQLVAQRRLQAAAADDRRRAPRQAVPTEPSPSTTQVARRLKDGRLELVDGAGAGPRAGHGGGARRGVGDQRGHRARDARGRPQEPDRQGARAARPGPAGDRPRPPRGRRPDARARAPAARGARPARLQRRGHRGRGRTRRRAASRPATASRSRARARANHAEVDIVPVAPVRAGAGRRLDATHAAFATLGAIAMHGFRRAEVAVGATVAVIGLGIIGQLAVRIALRRRLPRDRASTSTSTLVELARAAGAEAYVRSELDARAVARGQRRRDPARAPPRRRNDPVELAAKLARDRAAVVVVGDVGMDVPREPFYDKELDLRLSRSYGPGRYDPDYERWGIDYPIGYVRWTEQRNMQAFLDLVGARQDRRRPELITHRFAFDRGRAGVRRARRRAAAGRSRARVRSASRDGALACARAAPAARTARRRPNVAPRFGLDRRRQLRHRDDRAAPARARASSRRSSLRRRGCRPRAHGRGSASRRASADPDEVIAPRRRRPGRDRDPPRLPRAADRRGAARPARRSTSRSRSRSTPRASSCVRAALAESDAPLCVGFNRRYAPAAAELRDALGRAAD